MAQDERFAAELTTFVPRLRAFGRTLSGQHATGEDLAQETVMRAWRARASFEMGTNMEAWLFCILRNLHISGVRRAARMKESPIDHEAHHLASHDDPGAGVAMAELRRALNRLPAEQREALVLVGAAGCSYVDAAARVGCPVGTSAPVIRSTRSW